MDSIRKCFVLTIQTMFFLFVSISTSSAMAFAEEEVTEAAVEVEAAVEETLEASAESSLEEVVEAPAEVADVAAANEPAAAAEQVQEAVEEKVEAPAPEADYSDVETLQQFHPDVYIVPLGKEMNLKVEYSHPMDFTNDNYIKKIQMETLDGTFLGLKTFHERSKKAYAEFLVNPTLADFEEVVLVAESSKEGTIKSVSKLEMTPLDLLPDKYNPKKARELALKRAAEVKQQMKEQGIVPGGRDRQAAAEKAAAKVEDKKEESKKKKFGLF